MGIGQGGKRSISRGDEAFLAMAGSTRSFYFMLYFLPCLDYDNDEEGGHCDEGDSVRDIEDGHGQYLTNLFEITQLDKYKNLAK